jgi:hypothetical protein
LFVRFGVDLYQDLWVILVSTRDDFSSSIFPVPSAISAQSDEMQTLTTRLLEKSLLHSTDDIQTLAHDILLDLVCFDNRFASPLSFTFVSKLAQNAGPSLLSRARAPASSSNFFADQLFPVSLELLQPYIPFSKLRRSHRVSCFVFCLFFCKCFEKEEPKRKNVG